MKNEKICSKILRPRAVALWLSFPFSPYLGVGRRIHPKPRKTLAFLKRRKPKAESKRELMRLLPSGVKNEKPNSKILRSTVAFWHLFRFPPLSVKHHINQKPRKTLAFLKRRKPKAENKRELVRLLPSG